MGSSGAPPAFVSIVLTVRDEQAHLERLLESLLSQTPPFEIVLVDAHSRDRTWAISQQFEHAHPLIYRGVQRRGSRGIGRNLGVALARAELIAFTDGDCFADSGWLDAIRAGFEHSDVVAGRTVAVGSAQYGLLERVELFQRGNDVTYPSCNLGYRRGLFLRLGGFDPRFITAEDIDLNLRAVETGVSIRYEPDARVYHQVRANLVRFLYQAFWNGYGRKQLTEKHGALWGHYRLRRLVTNQRTLTAWFRLVGALLGYGVRVFTGFGRRLDSAPAPAPEFDAASA
ncbi:MAG: glycosyltransferase [Thermoplasmata archaeon]|nr:glycosyltransferase [Thermoplasmata archaeon]MCI4359866.1 glycosyltransferase [Thermoplasmata archaeon]